MSAPDYNTLRRIELTHADSLITSDRSQINTTDASSDPCGPGIIDEPSESEELPVDNDVPINVLPAISSPPPTNKRKARGKTPIVDDEVRRSSRLQQNTEVEHI